MDCFTGSPMADTCVRQVVVIDDGVKCSRDTQQKLLHPEDCGGWRKRARGTCFARGRLVTWDVGGSGRRGTSPLSRGRLMRSLRYPQGTQTVVVLGRVRGRGPARVQVVIDSL